MSAATDDAGAAAPEVSALLERLVAQFASPYDFLRELVQNAMDAGSDRVEVTLATHPVDPAQQEGGGGPDEVVFELGFADTGKGMDESTVDNELTRLFSSGKADDRTMAGGFGIGFVSVFAWSPDAVLLQTGRAGEGLELLFFADRSFEKSTLDMPVEGTSLWLFRRGRAQERQAVAEAIRDALWRWCRYCPLEITFEDLDAGGPPELIEDRPETGEGVLTRVEQRGDTRIQVAFGVPAHAVLMRRGLILEEGSPRQALAELAEPLGRSVEHLRVWADSPLLRTTLARDKVVDDAGRVEIGRRIVALVAALRVELFARLESLVAEVTVWSEREHGQYAMLVGHLLLECAGSSGRPREELRTRPLLRAAGATGTPLPMEDRAWSLDGLRRKLDGRPVLVSMGRGEDPALLAALAAYELPVLVGSTRDDGAWLAELFGVAELEVVELAAALSRVAPHPDEAVALCGLVAQLLARGGLGQLEVRLGRLVDAVGVDPPLFGVEPRRRPLPGESTAVPVALHGGACVPVSACRRATLWLNRDHLLVQAAVRSFAAVPLVAATTLAMAVVGRLGPGAPGPSELARVADELEAG